MYWNKGHQLHNGKYIIEDELGQGAFGITYKAVHSRINLPVVIKTPNMRLKRDRQYPRYVQKFIQEAELLGQLCQAPHPNIVRVIDYFDEGDSNTPCLVMEFIAGKNLFDLIEGQVITILPQTEAIKYICQIGDALAAMHQNSLVHRDIHPGNIMLRSGNHPILIDFGLAGDIAPATSFSRSFGNKNFAPYEQMNGSKDITVDIYGLAATLYYVVTGEYPTTSWDRKYHQADLIEPKQHKPSISEQLNLAIIEGMRLEPEDRPQTIQAWLKLLVNKTLSHNSFAQAKRHKSHVSNLLPPAISSGTVLQDRYCLVTILRQGEFGRTYLAEDINRFRELCAIKEFIPTATEASALEKAEELFQREADILYQIQHLQVPRFREKFHQDQRLFLVKDYVEGQTYLTLLNQRQAMGLTFTETEVLQLIQSLLPVLEHIHNQGIIHRDISPENIILRNSDGKPVLIGFGVAKELATGLQQPNSPMSVTSVGKLGYSPNEQLQTGITYPSSDLYALAVTAVVLLTGREPTDLFDENQLTWNWQQWVKVNPGFTQVLNRMLNHLPSDRYQNARDVRLAISK